MGDSFTKMTNIYNDLENCEIQRLNTLNVLKINLLLAGIAVLCFTFLALAAYLFFIDKHLNLIWELVRIRAFNSFIQLKDNVEARLTLIHEKDDFIENDFNSAILKNKQPLKFRHSIRTTTKFSVIFLVAAIFMILQCFILEQNLQDSLWYHPTLTSATMNKKILIARIAYYVIECKIDPLSSLFPYYNTVPNPQDNL